MLGLCEEDFKSFNEITHGCDYGALWTVLLNWTANSCIKKTLFGVWIIVAGYLLSQQKPGIT